MCLPRHACPYFSSVLVAENKKGREPSGARPLAIPLGKSAKSRARSNPCWRTGDQAASRRGYAPANAHRPPRSRFRASLCNLALSARTSSLFTYAPFVGSSSFFLYANAYSNLPNESITELFNRRSHIDVAPVTATIRSPHGSVRHPEAASSSTPRRAWRIHVRPVHATSHEAARRGRRARRHTSARPALEPRKIHTRRRESPSGGDRCPARGSRTHCAAHADDDVRAAPRLLVEDAIGDLGLLCRQHAHCSPSTKSAAATGHRVRALPQQVARGVIERLSSTASSACSYTRCCASVDGRRAFPPPAASCSLPRARKSRARTTPTASANTWLASVSAGRPCMALPRLHPQTRCRDSTRGIELRWSIASTAQ